MKKNIRQVGDSIFDKRLLQLAKRYPYQSFVVMSAALEFLGKCYSKRSDFQESGHSPVDCNNVINSLSALKKYSKYKDLYHNLRCGMLHAFTPDGIILTRGINDIDNNKIGAREFCADLRRAREELKMLSDYKKHINKTFILDVAGTSSGSTLSQL
jgi:hypothetical protein